MLTALAYPILVGEFAFYLVTEAAGSTPGWFFTDSLALLHITTITAGFLSTIAIGLMGLARRDRLDILHRRGLGGRCV